MTQRSPSTDFKPSSQRLRTARRLSWIFFGGWSLLAAAAADFPPPPGFALAILLIAACAFLVYRRVPVYLNWRARGTKWQLLRVIRDGAIGGGAAGLLVMVLSAGEPSVSPGPTDRLIGFTLMMVLGIGNALAVYAAASFGTARLRPEKTPRR